MGIAGFGGGVVRGGDVIGAHRVAGQHEAARQVDAAGGPCGGFAQAVGAGAALDQQLGRVGFAALAVAPDEAVIGQAGRILQRLGHRGDFCIDAGRLFAQGDARFGQLALTVIHQRQHAAGADQVIVPQQPVEPGSVMRRQQLAMGRQIGGLNRLAHWHGAPGQHQFRLAIAFLAAGDQRGGMGQHTFGGLRRLIAEKAEHGVAPGGDDGRFAVAAQPVQAGPVGAPGEKGNDLGRGAVTGAQAVPFDNVARHRSLRAGGVQRGAPFSRFHAGHCPRQRLGLAGKGGQGKRGPQQCGHRQNSRHHLHFPGNQG